MSDPHSNAQADLAEALRTIESVISPSSVRAALVEWAPLIARHVAARHLEYNEAYNGLQEAGLDGGLEEADIKSILHRAFMDGLTANALQQNDVVIDFNDATKRLAGLKRPQYEQVRVSEAQTLGVRVTELDRAVAEARKNDKPLFPAIEPWPTPVNGAALLDELTTAIRQYLILPPYGAEIVALWIVHAHAHDAAVISPILAAQSPEKGCGKTTLLDVLEATVPRPLLAANITQAVLFRVVELHKPTILIDEGDRFLHGNEELIGVLNSGHRINGGVWRCEGDNHTPTCFRTWSPKAVASINVLPDTLQDRSIPIRLKRKRIDERVRSFRLDRCDELKTLACKAARWAADHLDQLRTSDPEMPGKLTNRTADNWRPLLAIADLAGGDWPKKARSAALSHINVAAGPGDGDLPLQLLADCRTIFYSHDDIGTVVTPTQLVTRLIGLPERPWSDMRDGRGLSTHTLAKMLKPFDIKSVQMRHEHLRDRFYQRRDFEDAWVRYLPSSPAPSGTTGTSGTALKNNDNFVPFCSPNGTFGTKNGTSGTSGTKIVNEINDVPDVPVVPDGGDELHAAATSGASQVNGAAQKITPACFFLSAPT